jgi:hypothetical protein
MGHQESAREARRYTHQGRDTSEFGNQESDFKSNSESSTTLPSN